jgi:hypothetical protein
MYDTKYECRYHKDDVFLDTDNVTSEEKDYIRSILYKEDMLNIFGIDMDDDFESFNNILSELYVKIKNNDFLIKCMTKTSSTLFCQNIEFGLCLLYSYDFMYLTHKCVSEYLDKGIISEENKKLLNDSINN